MADEDYAYGSGNGGRSCAGVSCVSIILGVAVLLVTFGLPLLTNGQASLGAFTNYVGGCGGMCMCLGSIGVLVAVFLIFTDDPEKNAQKEKERKLKAARARRAQK